MTTSQPSYRVLARKYRPTKFSQIIGQNHMVQTLVHAFELDRIAHAFIFTGVRGVGKTTTARLLARGLNCIGSDGTGKPTPEPCGACAQCTAIATDSHVDIIEVDAASRTGVEDMRDLLEGIRYKPVMGRYKVYIIDEVHMLSRNAFNALLKTLEEPPTHVVFIFATTEIHKVPLTILSRCQRFDLRRVEVSVMASYFESILKQENTGIDPAALNIICKCAEGSVRDGQSLLDQAITGSTNQHITTIQVQNMLGLSDKSTIIQIFQSMMGGNVQDVFNQIHHTYYKGAEPIQIIQDLLEISHQLSLLKLNPKTIDTLGKDDKEKEMYHNLVQALSIPVLNYTWQLLLKGLQEIKVSPLPLQALEMILIRIMHVVEVMKPSLKSEPPASPAQEQKSGNTSPNPAALLAQELQNQFQPLNRTDDLKDVKHLMIPKTFAELIQLCQDKREMLLAATLESSIHLISFQPGEMHYRLKDNQPKTDISKLQKLLNEWTQIPWKFVVSDDGGDATLLEQRQAYYEKLKNHEKVQEILSYFPGSIIENIH